MSGPTSSLAAGGDAFLESTPAVLTWYQARAGQQFTLGLGVDRLREYSLDRLRRLKRYLAAHGVEAQGADDGHGAFLTVELRPLPRSPTPFALTASSPTPAIAGCAFAPIA